MRNEHRSRVAGGDLNGWVGLPTVGSTKNDHDLMLMLRSPDPAAVLAHDARKPVSPPPPTRARWAVIDALGKPRGREYGPRSLAYRMVVEGQGAELPDMTSTSNRMGISRQDLAQDRAFWRDLLARPANSRGLPAHSSGVTGTVGS
jgi:hypothetical protein